MIPSVTSRHVNKSYRYAEGGKVRASPYGPFKGQTEVGNVDLEHRRKVPLGSHGYGGNYATVRSMSFEDNGQEVLVPGLNEKRYLTPKEAREQYRKTGKHLGKFDTPVAADNYARELHKAQERFYKEK